VNYTRFYQYIVTDSNCKWEGDSRKYEEGEVYFDQLKCTHYECIEGQFVKDDIGMFQYEYKYIQNRGITCIKKRSVISHIYKIK